MMSHQDIKHSTIISWPDCVKMSAGDEEAARVTLQLILETLPEDYQTIQTLYIQKNYQPLEDQVHRLHGSLCYTGIPLLKAATKDLESTLRQKDYAKVDAKFATFKRELDKFLGESERLGLG